MNYLHSVFPEMAVTLPYMQLGKLPTPVKKLLQLNKKFESDNLYCKCDDIAGSIYGGNKIRKLEFIFADAKKQGAKRLITSGMIGSNHALATALYGRECGFKVVLMLFGEQKGEHIVKNLIADYYSDAEICYDETFEEHQKSLEKMDVLYRQKDGVSPYIIPAGGSSVIGLAGYINAAFELKNQIKSGELEEPDVIFLPFGTMGTAAGIVIGIKLAGLKSVIIPVQVVPTFVSDQKKFIALINSGLSCFKKFDRSFPEIEISNDDYMIDKEQLGQGYGISTPGAEEAIRLFWDLEKIKLDSVYSGKAAAAFVKYVRSDKNRGKTVLFWNTKSSVVIPEQNYYDNVYPEWFKLLLEKAQSNKIF